MSTNSPSPRRRISRLTALGAVVLLVGLVATGCDRGRVGARCRGTGWGEDGGAWILRCQKGRWVRALTKADYARIIIASQPTTTPPPTTVAPPTTLPPALTSFAAVDLPIGDLGTAVRPGLYITVPPAGQRCSWATYDDADDLIGGYESFAGQMYLRVPDTDGSVVTTGPCQWTTAPMGARPIAGDGMMRLNVDMEAGYYRAPGGTDCYWEATDSDDGAPESITVNQAGPYPQAFYLQPSATTFFSQGCGTWEHVTNWTDRVFVTSTADDPLFHGASLGWMEPATPIGLAGSMGDVTVTVDGWTLRFRAPAGQQFPSIPGTTYTNVAATPDASHAAFTLTGHGQTCAVASGSVSVAPIQNANTGDIWRLGAQFDVQCGAQGHVRGDLSINQL